jgi:flagellar hook-length control protein FliK
VPGAAVPASTTSASATDAASAQAAQAVATAAPGAAAPALPTDPTAATPDEAGGEPRDKPADDKKQQELVDPTVSPLVAAQAALAVAAVPATQPTVAAQSGSAPAAADDARIAAVTTAAAPAQPAAAVPSGDAADAKAKAAAAQVPAEASPATANATADPAATAEAAPAAVEPAQHKPAHRAAAHTKTPDAPAAAASAAAPAGDATAVAVTQPGAANGTGHEHHPGHGHDHAASQQATAVQGLQAPTASPRAAQPVETRVAEQPAPLHAQAQLHDLADVAGTTMRVAVREGRTEARITLRPVELGQVEIRLHYHDGGVSAQLTAQAGDAAQALSSTASDLRRSLEAQGLVVHDLDVVQTGAHDRPQGERSQNGRQGSGASSSDRSALGPDESEETVVNTSRLPLAGSQVDVLA